MEQTRYIATISINGEKQKIILNNEKEKQQLINLSINSLQVVSVEKYDDIKFLREK